MFHRLVLFAYVACGGGLITGTVGQSADFEALYRSVAIVTGTGEVNRQPVSATVLQKF